MTCKILPHPDFNGKSNFFFPVWRLPLPTSSFQRPPALRVGGPADQQLHRQRVLGAPAPERPHTGVQGETSDARDGSEGGDPKQKKKKGKIGTGCSGSLGGLYRFQLSC